MSTQFPLFNAPTNGRNDDSMPGSKKAGRAVLHKLWQVRRSLTDEEKVVALVPLDVLIRDIQSRIKADPEEAEKMVLYSIEYQGAVSEIEISEDTRLHRTVVRKAVETLLEKGILYKTQHFVVGMDRPRWRLNSARQDNDRR